MGGVQEEILEGVGWKQKAIILYHLSLFGFNIVASDDWKWLLSTIQDESKPITFVYSGMVLVFIVHFSYCVVKHEMNNTTMRWHWKSILKSILLHTSQRRKFQKQNKRKRKQKKKNQEKPEKEKEATSDESLLHGSLRMNFLNLAFMNNGHWAFKFNEFGNSVIYIFTFIVFYRFE